MTFKDMESMMLQIILDALKVQFKEDFEIAMTVPPELRFVPTGKAYYLAKSNSLYILFNKDTIEDEPQAIFWIKEGIVGTVKIIL